MPNELTGALTRKFGPLPGWAWAGTGAVGLALIVFMRGKSGSAPAAPTGLASSGRPGTIPGSVGYATPDYSLGYSQGMSAASAPASSATSPPATSPGGTSQPTTQQVVAGSNNPYLQYTGGQVPLYASIGGVMQQIAGVPSGTTLTVSTTPTTSKYGSGTQVYGSATFFAVQTPVPGTYISAGDITYSQPTGVGGGRRSNSIGSRSRSPHMSVHPDIKRQPQYQHFIQNAGGAANHHASVRRAAKAAGVHPARIHMLNPQPGHPIRIA